MVYNKIIIIKFNLMDKELQEQIEKLNEVLDKLIQDYTKNIAELGEAINSLTKTICQK